MDWASDLIWIAFGSLSAGKISAFGGSADILIDGDDVIGEPS